MIRVLHYGMGPRPGGIETYLRDLWRHADRERYHFDYFYSDTGQEPYFAGLLRAEGSDFFPITARRENPLRNRRDLRHLLVPERFDILHFHCNTMSYAAPVRVALVAGLRVMVHSHNAGAQRRLTRVLHRVNRSTIPWRRITKLAVSEPAGAWMFGEAGTDVLAPNGIDVERFAFDPAARARVRAEFDLADLAVVGHVGGFLPAKNHLFLLRAFALLATARPDVALLLVGGGPLIEQARHESARLGLGGRVVFTGPRDDVPDLLAAMDCFAFPSVFEGFGLAVLEAEANGLPCVVSEAVPAEVVLDPAGGRLPLDVGLEAWAARLADALDAPRRRGDGVARVAGAGYSLAERARLVTDVYSRLVGSEPPE